MKTCSEPEPEQLDYNENDPDFKDSERKKQPRGETVTLEVPRDILKKISITNARCGQGAGKQILVLSEIIEQSGGDIKDFVISKSSARRFRQQVATSVASHIKDNFAEKFPA